MRFSLFPHLFKFIFCIWVPNMASLSGPILYFHHSDVQGGCWRYFTHAYDLFFLRFSLCLLVIIQSPIV
jgi:hypothetical protein